MRFASGDIEIAGQSNAAPKAWFKKRRDPTPGSL
jgi:hypothetical protein